MGIASSLAFFAICLWSKCSEKPCHCSILTVVPNAHPDFNDRKTLQAQLWAKSWKDVLNYPI